MKSKASLAAAFVFLALPGVWAVGDAIAFRVRNANNASIVSSGVRREYLLHVPHSYDASKPASLVIVLHGAGGWPVQQMHTSGWNRLADREGFLVAYPSAKIGSSARVWRLDEELDVRFISELIDDIAAHRNIDRRRIYVNGLSNGGAMSFVLSCRLSQKIAAVGMVAAAQSMPWSACRDSHAVPVIAFHGTADGVVPYRGGTSWVTRSAFPDVERWIGQWARRNGCSAEPSQSGVAPDVVRRQYRDCRADVALYTIRGGGHTWPGGEPLPEWFVGPTTRSIDATSLMWAFFQNHPLAR